MKVIRKCPSCRFYDGGVCHRYPPQAIVTPNHQGGHMTDYVQPWVYSDNWCGEYKHDKRKFAALVLTSK